MEDNVHPKYHKEETAISGVPYAEKTCLIYSSVSSTINPLRFLSAPRQHINEVGCARLRASYGTNMSHWGPPGLGLIPLLQDDYAIPMVSVGKVYSGGVSVRKLSLGIPPQITSIR